MYDIDINNVDTVILDFDETIAKSIESLSNYLADFDFKDMSRPNYKDTRKWNLQDIFPDVTTKQVEDAFGTFRFFDTLRLYEDMVEAMKWFKSKGKEIIILSLGTSRNIHFKSRFIERNLYGLYDYFIYAGSDRKLKMNKSIFHIGNPEKTVIVDDCYTNLVSNPAKYKIMAKLHTSEQTEWSSDEHGNEWQGLKVHSGEELINMFR